MPLWGTKDNAINANSSTTTVSTNGAIIGTYVHVKGDQVGRADGSNAHFGNTSPGSRANVDVRMYGNTTIGAFIPGKAVGLFAVDSTEIANSFGNVISGTITYSGSGYTANATATLTIVNGGTGANVTGFANVSTGGTGGKITSVTLVTGGSGYLRAPTIVFSAPTALNIQANTAGVVNNGTNTAAIALSSANTKLQVGDRVFYTVPTNNTAITGLGGNSYLWITFSNGTHIAVSNTSNGPNVAFTAPTTTPAETHTLTGDTATGTVTVNGARNLGVAHTGWNLRTEGSGGRAGRVFYECLVAGGISTDNANDNIILP